MPGSFFFFFNDTATTEIYTLSLHDALPICLRWWCGRSWRARLAGPTGCCIAKYRALSAARSEEHTSELQSLRHLVCRLLLEKKKIEIILLPTADWLDAHESRSAILSVSIRH